MLRSITRALIGVSLVAGLTHAAIWPDQFGAFTRTSAKPAAIADKPLWDEYGLEETEAAEYSSTAGHFSATAFRFRDPTGALAAFQWQRPAQAKRSDLGSHAAETPQVVVLAFHNYLFRIESRRPTVEELAPILARLPKLDQSALPILPGYLPSKDLTPNSERYVLGPVSLERFDSRIPPSVAAFHLGTEAQLGRFAAGAAEMTLAVFSYPTPSFARELEGEFSKLTGAMVKRTGPLVAVILSPPDRDAAERLLAQVRYEASISWTEYRPSARDNVGNLILGVVKLVGVLLLFCLFAGLAFAGVRKLGRRYFKQWSPDEPMIMLHIEDR